jgi:hypothetical protein
MSSSINLAFVEDFESSVHHLGQQDYSTVMGNVRYRAGTGDIYTFNRMGASDMGTKTVRHSATPINNVASSVRKGQVITHDWGEAVDQSDIARILIDPDSEYKKAAAAAYGRRIDRTVYSAAVSDTATTDGTAAVAFPAGQKIGNGLAALSVDYLRQAKRKHDEAEIMGDRFIAVSAAGLEDLLAITEVASVDYNSVKALVQGELDTFMGYKFIRTEQGPSVGFGDDNVVARGALCWVRDTLACAVSDENFTRVGPDPSIRFSTRIYMETTLAGVRIEDAGIVLIDHTN